MKNPYGQNAYGSYSYMLQMKRAIEKRDYRHHHESFATTDTILKVMKEISIPDSDCLPHNLGNELCGCVTVPTYPQILENVQWSWRRCIDEPSSAKKINHAGVVCQFCRNLVNSTILPARSAWLQAERRKRKVTSSGSTSCSHVEESPCHAHAG